MAERATADASTSTESDATENSSDRQAALDRFED
jgi:hypothetical protein